MPARLRLLLAGAVLLALAHPARADVVDTTYVSHEGPIGGQYLLTAGDGLVYSMSKAVFDRHQALFYTVARDDPIRIEYGPPGRTVISVTVGGSGGSGDGESELSQQLRGLTRGDIVEINGYRFRFLAFEQGEVRLSPLVPGTDPPEYSGRRTLSLAEVRTLEVIETRRSGDGGENGGGTPDASGVNDMLSRENVAPGDTVVLRMLPGAGPQSMRGRIVAMNRTTVRVQSWRGHRFTKMTDLPRQDVRRVERIKLRSARNLTVDEMPVRLSEVRYVEGNAGKAICQAEVQHDEPGKVLVGLWVRPLVDGEMLSEGEALLPLFPGMPRTVDLREANVVRELTLDATGLTSLDSAGPEAQGLLIEAIEQSAAQPEELGSLLKACVDSGNEELFAYVVGRVLLPRSGADADGSLTVAALRDHVDRVADYVLQQLSTPNDALRLVLVRDFELVRAIPPGSLPPTELRSQLIQLLGELPGGVDADRAETLFAAGLRDRNLQDGLARAFAANADQTVPFLLLRASDRRSTPEESQTAARVLQNMSEAALGPLAGALVARGINAEELVKAQEQDRPALDQIDLAISLARRHVYDGLLKEARRHFEQGELEPARQVVRQVLLAYPEHTAALALLEEIRLPLARQLISQRRRSEAMRLLEGTRVSEGRTRLAALYLEAAQEELTGVVVRDEPHVAAQNIGVLDKGTVVRGKAVDADWVQVDFSAERRGFVRSVCLEGSGSYTVRVIYLPVPSFEQLLERAKELAPDLGPQCQRMLGQRYIQEAEQTYNAGDYGLALTLFEKARPLVDENDPRLSLERLAWLQDNLWLFASLLGLLVLAAVIYILANALRRRRKIKLADEGPIEIKTASGRVTRKVPTKRQKEQPRESWTSPMVIVKLLLASSLGGVILYQAWKLYEAF